MVAIYYQIVVRETEPENSIGFASDITGFALLRQFGPVEAWGRHGIEAVDVFWRGLAGVEPPSASDYELEVLLPGQNQRKGHDDACVMAGEWSLAIGSNHNLVTFRLYRREEAEARISEWPH